MSDISLYAATAASLLLLFAACGFCLVVGHVFGYRRGQADRPDYKRAVSVGHRLGLVEGEAGRDVLRQRVEELMAELEDLRRDYVNTITGDGYDQVTAAISHDGTEGAR